MNGFLWGSEVFIGIDFLKDINGNFIIITFIYLNLTDSNSILVEF